MDRKRRLTEIAMHVSAAALMLLAFLLLDLGAQALGAPENQGDNTLISLVPLGLALLALMAELVALGLRRRRF